MQNEIKIHEVVIIFFIVVFLFAAGFLTGYFAKIYQAEESKVNFKELENQNKQLRNQNEKLKMEIKSSGIIITKLREYQSESQKIIKEAENDFDAIQKLINQIEKILDL